MPLHSAEAFILRTYPFKESDRVVSFFTRELGKRRGVARGSRRPKSKFGATLEPLTQVRIQFFEREGRELCSIDNCELIASPLATRGRDLLHSVAVSVMAEVAERMLPEAEVSDAVFRLLVVASSCLRAAGAEAGCWLPLTYYLYWMVRLGGFLPALNLSPESQSLLDAIATTPLAGLPAEAAAGLPGLELRRRLYGCLTSHLEAELRSWPMLASLECAC